MKNITAFSVIAKSINGKIPTRVNHQLVYGGNEKIKALDCSINVSLTNDTIFTPSYKKSFVWGAALRNKNYNSNIGFCFKKNTGNDEKVEVDFYDESGKIKTKKFFLKPSTSEIIDVEKLFRCNEKNKYLWYVAKSDRADLNAYSVHKNKLSNNSSGEHNF